MLVLDSIMFFTSLKVFNTIQKKLTSSYNKLITFQLYDEVYVNGENSTGQHFFVDKVEYKYSIYPVILDNIEGKMEHVLSIIVIYNENLYLTELGSSNSSFVVKIILELLIFIIFGWGLLHIVILTFNTLSKYIVIPIKNVNYMLKGINIGGKYRLDFLDYLKKRRDDNLEKLEKMYLLDEKQNNNNIDLDEISSNNSAEITDKNLTTEIDGSKNIELKEKDDINENININEHINFNQKYDEESQYIEKEINFYDFDEALLRYRPLEIENLVKLLIDIKEALILTSSDQPIKQIIDYSHTEDIFRNFKNKNGTTICQSNIGNLQMQLMKYDKAI